MTTPRGTAQSWNSPACFALSFRIQAPRVERAGPRVFGYLDPDAFIEADARGASTYGVTASFGALVLAGPIRRPDWF
jgi:hypothetical protein